MYIGEAGMYNGLDRESIRDRPVARRDGRAGGRRGLQEEIDVHRLSDNAITLSFCGPSSRHICGSVIIVLRLDHEKLLS